MWLWLVWSRVWRKFLFFCFFNLNLIFGVYRNWQNIWYMGNRDRILEMMQRREIKKSENSKNQPGSVFTIYQLRFLLSLWLTMSLGLWTLNTFGLALETSPGLINKPSKFVSPQGLCLYIHRLKFKSYISFPCRLKLKLLYMFVAGFYTYSIFALIFWETRRSDFGVSMGHHIATLILIVLSYVCRYMLPIITLLLYNGVLLLHIVLIFFFFFL